jgi:pimeloyl-ACP methyl ester carboxylesterase
MGTVHRVAVNGVELVVHDDGPADGPLVILSHGFPEGAYSWRHQLPALAAAGYRVLAPDQRGYGESSRPDAVSDYGIEQLTGDLIALAEWAGHQQAIYVGHDWGALIVWEVARLHPERCRAVVGVSVPFTNWPMRPTELFRLAFGDNFFYMAYFQEVGPADRELEADPRLTMAKILHGGSGDAFTETLPAPRPAAGTGFLDLFGALPETVSAWLTEADLDHYAEQFRRSGFFGPLSYYRNLDANFDLLHDLAPERIDMPSFFIGGSLDHVVVRNARAIESMRTVLPDFRGTVLIPDAGHWTQQERPDEFNAALLEFLAGV